MNVIEHPWSETRKLDEATLLRTMASPRCAVPAYRHILQWEVDVGWNGREAPCGGSHKAICGSEKP